MIDVSRLVRPELLDLAPVAHGSVAAMELAALGLQPAEVLDFSVNTNPLGPSPSVLRAVRETDWSRYPGDDDAPLRRALAEQTGVTPEQVVLGNGSAELMWLIALAALRAGDQVGIVVPTFGEYARAAHVVGATVLEVEDPEQAPSARVLFVCNPNNPTADYLTPADIERLLEAAPDRLLILDEAYAAFVEHRWLSEPLLEHGNLVILRSMTKDHALPGLRLGYLLAAREVARAIDSVRPPWSVNSGALRAGLAALEPPALAHVGRARAIVAESRVLLTDGLARLGYTVRPSAANFVLVDVGNGARFRQALLPHGIVVRDCASFGLPQQVRIACRLPADCQRLLDAITQIAAPHAVDDG
ncbi:MAG TPA: histidinol-phosphate transaminase [Chloroflexota bacterium]